MSAKRLHSLYLVAALGLAGLLAAFVLAKGSGAEDRRSSAPPFRPLRIAHAGGGLNGMQYTNSYQALDQSIAKGYIYFEIDFLYTSDDKLVCLHDWEQAFYQAFGFPAHKKVTLEDFEALAEESKAYTSCTLDGLASWMKRNPGAYLVTDVKGDNLKALRRIHAAMPDANRRVIPQMYQPENVAEAKAMGFEQMIWTLYRYSGDDDAVVTWVRKLEPPLAITMPKHRAKTPLPKRLAAQGIPSYVHTVNSPQEARDFQTRFGLTEVYTDFLPPTDG